MTIHSSGTSMIAATGIRNRCRGLNGSRRRGFSGGVSTGSRRGAVITWSVISRAVIDRPPADQQLNERDDQDAEEQDIRDSRAIAAIEELERLLVEVVDDHRGRAQRAA